MTRSKLDDNTSDAKHISRRTKEHHNTHPCETVVSSIHRYSSESLNQRREEAQLNWGSIYEYVVGITASPSLVIIQMPNRPLWNGHYGPVEPTAPFLSLNRLSSRRGHTTPGAALCARSIDRCRPWRLSSALSSCLARVPLLGATATASGDGPKTRHVSMNSPASYSK